MNNPDAISILNRLYWLTLRSFAVYSAEVRPVTFRGPEAMWDLLKEIAVEERDLAGRIAAAIAELRGAAEPGQYPIEFTAWNDVALSRVFAHAIELQSTAVAEASDLASEHSEAPVFYWAKQVQGQAERHVTRLEEALAAE